MLPLYSIIHNQLFGGCILTCGIASQLSTLEFTLVHWGAFRGHTGNEGSITPTLQLTVLNIKLLSRLTHTQTHLNCVSRRILIGIIHSPDPSFFNHSN